MNERERYTIIGFLVSFVVASLVSYFIIKVDLSVSLVIGAFIGVFVAILILNSTPTLEAKEFANVMGLNIHRGNGYSMDGNYRDHPVRIKYIPGGEDSNPQTDFEVKCQNLAKIDMDISKRGLTSKLMEKLGRKCIEIGVPEFDERFTIRGYSETDVMLILDDSTQQKIQSLEHFSHIKLHENKINISVYDDVIKRRLLKKFLDVLIDIAENIEGKEPSTDIAQEYDEKLGIT